MARLRFECANQQLQHQFQRLALSLEARVRQAVGQEASVPEGGYTGDYVVDLATSYLEQHGSRPGGPAPAALGLGPRARVEHFGRWAVDHFVREQRRVLGDYGVHFEVWTSEQRDVRDRRLAEKIDWKPTAINCLTACAPNGAKLPLVFDSDRDAVERWGRRKRWTSGAAG